MEKLRALSIKQPWSWLIVNGHKDIENRSRRTAHRGRVLVHASKVADVQAYKSLVSNRHPVTGDRLAPEIWEALHTAMRQNGGWLPAGGIVGEVTIIDCVDSSPSPWFVGPRGYVLRDGKPRPFLACKGALGFFSPWDEVAR